MNIFFLFKNSITVNLNTKQSINLTFCKTESFDQEREIRPGKSQAMKLNDCSMTVVILRPYKPPEKEELNIKIYKNF